jgi:hypothetical protein
VSEGSTAIRFAAMGWTGQWLWAEHPVWGAAGQWTAADLEHGQEKLPGL